MRYKVVNEEENITSDEDESIDVSSNSQSLQATNTLIMFQQSLLF